MNDRQRPLLALLALLSLLAPCLLSTGCGGGGDGDGGSSRSPTPATPPTLATTAVTLSGSVDAEGLKAPALLVDGVPALRDGTAWRMQIAWDGAPRTVAIVLRDGDTVIEHQELALDAR